MRKKVSIGLLGLILIIILLLIFVYRMSYRHALDKIENERVENQIDLEEYYFIKDQDGYVTVYYADKKTIYEYTSIPTNDLPDSVQEELKDGKKVTSVGQVYGFLENYSS